MSYLKSDTLETLNSKSKTNENQTWQSKKLLPVLLDHHLIDQLFNLMKDGVIIHDNNRTIYFVNDATTQITGLSKDQILGFDCHNAFPPNGLCGSCCPLKNGTLESSQNREYEISFNRADGELRQVNVTSNSIKLSTNKQGVLVIIKDITEVNNLKMRLSNHSEYHGMIGGSKKINEIYETIRSVGNSDYSVLITGESGTGKELAAHAIHRESKRKTGPFVPVNCGALPENILESELFGHVRGAFTGAIRDKKGRFELASGGTLFLDEIGELSLQVQVKLLRVLQEKVFERVGGEKSIRSDIRVVSATNRNLKKMIKEGTFREDLFYRLCVVPIDLPPLRKRLDDVPAIVSKILADINTETGKKIVGIHDNAMKILLSYQWPGNIRELINALQFASIRCGEKMISIKHLPAEIRDFESKSISANDNIYNEANVSNKIKLLSTLGSSSDTNSDTNSSYNSESNSGADADHSSYSQTILTGSGSRSQLTVHSVSNAIKKTGGNRLQAAKLLKIGRATLYRFLKDNDV